MSEAEATSIPEDSVPVVDKPEVEVIEATAETAVGGAERWVEDFQRTVKESTDSAIRSARSLRNNSSSHFRSLQDFIPHALVQYKTYENAFFSKVTEELTNAKDHPAATVGLGVAAGLLLMRGPRRFLFRQTLGRFQSEEARYLKVEKNVQELNMTVDLMKKESRKLLERAALAEKDMKRGLSELMSSGCEVQRLAKSVYKVESQATDLMDVLRQISGRDALKLRAEVASMASILRQKRIALNKRIMKISELGVPV
ncbi:PREDICTED: uncharacterized protein LOC104811711 [Tarenaya hassleriana]|uniref:uncharacterized protein LOC104811711 n=1 Tax=Tarenaya hassleriana TaxID=28532 RepID=UPI00053C09D0|nr:PREDICTED: uncharacterized protein LOC104811711 [Tarenaya hassleriana]